MEKAKVRFIWPMVGNQHISDYLSRVLKNDKPGGAYIFSGPDNLGKTTVATFFSRALLCDKDYSSDESIPCGECPACQQFKVDKSKTAEILAKQESTHGDFHLVKKYKDKKNISIEQIRELIKILSMSSFLNSYKIGIIKHAETMTEEAANALLKTLEEPRPGVVIILITSQPDRLPATIISRSQILEFQAVSTDLIYDFLVNERKVNRSKAKNLSRLCLGRPALAVKFLEDEDFFTGYNQRLNVYLNFFSEDLNKRLAAIETLTGKSLRGQEQVKNVNRILEIWQGVTRDLLLLDKGQNDLIQHESATSHLTKILANYSIVKVINLLQLLNKSKFFLHANVNPKLVLEHIAFNI